MFQVAIRDTIQTKTTTTAMRTTTITETRATTIPETKATTTTTTAVQTPTPMHQHTQTLTVVDIMGVARRIKVRSTTPTARRQCTMDPLTGQSDQRIMDPLTGQLQFPNITGQSDQPLEVTATILS